MSKNICITTWSELYKIIKESGLHWSIRPGKITSKTFTGDEEFESIDEVHILCDYCDIDRSFYIANLEDYCTINACLKFIAHHKDI